MQNEQPEPGESQAVEPAREWGQAVEPVAEADAPAMDMWSVSAEGLIAGMRSSPPAKSAGQPAKGRSQPAVPGEKNPPVEEVTYLKSELNEWAKFIIASVMVPLIYGLLYWAWHWGDSGHMTTERGLFLTIWWLVFIACFLFPCLWVASTLALFNARARVWVRGRPHPGGILDLHWKFGSSGFRPERVKVSLKVKDVTTKREGDKQTTTEKVIHEAVIFESEVGDEDGSAQARLPGDLAPSREKNGVKTVWMLTVQGSVPRWPDVENDYVLTVFDGPIDLPFM